MLNPWHGVSDKWEKMGERCDEVKEILGVDNLNDIEEIKVYGPKMHIKTKKSKRE